MVLKYKNMKGKKPDYNFELINQLTKQGKTIKEIASIYNIAPSSFSRAMRKYNIDINLSVKKIDKDHNFFETIDSEIKAYLLGFFVADGCVYDNSRIGICIKKSDAYIIELFKNYIAPDSYVKEIHNKKGALNRQPQLFIRISSKKIVKDLSSYGIVPRKTYKPINIPNIENKYKHVFIRGYLDGDGSIRRRNPKQLILGVAFCNGDKTILEDIQKLYNCGRLTKSKNCYRLEIDNTEQALDMLRLVYKDANFYFKRKKDVFDLVNTEAINRTKKLLTP